MNNTKFNITELIEDYYNQGLPLPESIKKFDFLELTEKKYFIDIKDNTYPSFIKEPLAANLITHLPLEAYKEVFSLDWFTDSKTYHVSQDYILNAIIVNKKFDCLNYVIDNVEKSIPNKEVFSNLEHCILKPMRESLMDYTFSAMGYSKKDMHDFYQIWKRSLSILDTNFFDNIIRKKARGKNVREQFENTEYKSDIKELLNKLSSDSLCFEIFTDICKYIDKKNLKQICMLDEDCIAKNALYNCNKKLITFLDDNKLISSKNYIDILTDNFELDSSNTKKISTSDIWLYKKCGEVLSSQEKQSIPTYQLMGILDKFQKNEVIFNDILNNYPQWQTGNIFSDENNKAQKGSSLAEINYIMSVAQTAGYYHKNFLTNEHEGRDKVFKLLPLLKTQQPIKKPNIKDVEQLPFYENLISCIASKNSINCKQAETLFLQKFIELSLPEKQQSQRVKI